MTARFLALAASIGCKALEVANLRATLAGDLGHGAAGRRGEA